MSHYIKHWTHNICFQKRRCSSQLLSAIANKSSTPLYQTSKAQLAPEITKKEKVPKYLHSLLWLFCLSKNHFLCIELRIAACNHLTLPAIPCLAEKSCEKTSEGVKSFLKQVWAPDMGKCPLSGGSYLPILKLF